VARAIASRADALAIAAMRLGLVAAASPTDIFMIPPVCIAAIAATARARAQAIVEHAEQNDRRGVPIAGQLPC